MSVERYFAICHPLKSREWQTLSHAYKMLAAVWTGSLLCMSPIFFLSKLQNIKGTTKYKCRENWPSLTAERSFNILLDFVLLLIPLLIMSITYSMIIRTLWKAMEMSSEENANKDQDVKYCWSDSPSLSFSQSTSLSSHLPYSSKTSPSRVYSMKSRSVNVHFRHSNMERSILQKKRIIKMLFVVVLEFFICWTPLYVINTITLFNPKIVYKVIGTNGICFFQLLAYTSSCCNPVTYCFMNSRFRESFSKVFRCRKRRENYRAHICQPEPGTEDNQK